MSPVHPPPQDELSILDRIDDGLRQTRWQLRFEVHIERQFRRERRAQNHQTLQPSSLLPGLMMLPLLFADHMMVPDTMGMAQWLRLGFLALVCLWSLAVLGKQSAHPIHEHLALGSCLVVCAINLALISLSNSPWRQVYLLSSGLVILYANVLLRPRFELAMLASTFMLTAQALTGILMPEAVRDLRILLPIMIALLATAAFSLYFLYRLESEERHNYLMGWRQRLLQSRLAVINRELSALSLIDPLTEVPNRRRADEYLEQVWQRSRRSGHGLSVLMIDIDHFKAYNDDQGHPAGDACLRQVAQALAQSLRQPGDLLARYGGEEFIAILQDTQEDEALMAAERMCQAVRELNLSHPPSPARRVTVSVGVCSAAANLDGPEAPTWVAMADEALYEAKRDGRDQVGQARSVNRVAA